MKTFIISNKIPLSVIREYVGMGFLPVYKKRHRLFLERVKAKLNYQSNCDHNIVRLQENAAHGATTQ